MLAMALELARHRAAYEDIASKFFEHFVDIIDAMNNLGGDGLWHEEDGFYYDQILVDDGTEIPLRVRSLVGIIPLIAVEVLDQEVIKALPGFRKRMRWFLDNRHDLARHVSYMDRTSKPGQPNEEIRLLAIPSKARLVRVLRYVLDEKEFLSPFGIRSLSAAYREKPYVLKMDGSEHSIKYDPSESRSSMFGGNSNWRGPIWFPINYLIIEALEKYHHFYGDDVRVECPTGSGNLMNLQQVALEIATRLSRLFLRDQQGRRPCFADDPRFVTDPHWRDYLHFHEYFQGDTGRGLGASHQTGWTAMITRCINMVARVREE
jgi:glycogen debranching enzyme